MAQLSRGSPLVKIILGPVRTINQVVLTTRQFARLFSISSISGHRIYMQDCSVQHAGIIWTPCLPLFSAFFRNC